jgi:hypothetical protein
VAAFGDACAERWQPVTIERARSSLARVHRVLESSTRRRVAGGHCSARASTKAARSCRRAGRLVTRASAHHIVQRRTSVRSAQGRRRDRVLVAVGDAGEAGRGVGAEEQERCDVARQAGAGEPGRGHPVA